MESRTTASLRAQIEEGWRQFRGAVGSLSAEQFDQATASGWTVKQMLAHVAFWEETVLNRVPVLLGREEPPVEDWYGGADLGVAGDWPHFDVHNAREAAWAVGQPAERILGRLDRAHARVTALAAGLDDEQAANAEIWEKVTGETCGHYPEHLQELQQLAR